MFEEEVGIDDEGAKTCVMSNEGPRALKIVAFIAHMIALVIDGAICDWWASPRVVKLNCRTELKTTSFIKVHFG